MARTQDWHAVALRCAHDATGPKPAGGRWQNPARQLDSLWFSSSSADPVLFLHGGVNDCVVKGVSGPFLSPPRLATVSGLVPRSHVTSTDPSRVLGAWARPPLVTCGPGAGLQPRPRPRRGERLPRPMLSGHAASGSELDTARPRLCLARVFPFTGKIGPFRLWGSQRCHLFKEAVNILSYYYF